MGAVLFPAFRTPPQDSFPLSDFPMFSHGRPDPGMVLAQALGVRSNGEKVPLAPMISSGNREVLQSMMTIHRELHSPRASAFCAEIAERVAGEEDLRDVEQVELSMSTFDAVAYFEDAEAATERDIRVSCEVRR